MRTFGKFLVIVGAVCVFIFPPAGIGTMLVGFIMFMVGKDKKKEAEIEDRKEQERPCPYCQEPILKSAVKCKHCHSDVSPITHEPPINEIIKIEGGLWECRKCHTKMLLAGDFCSNCRKHKKEIAVRKA